ncbi:lipase family protein [Nocardia sp. NPDC056000]|uniref:lipase family protein n=1 Tax=Nocardia sp. NPDC056000 TaxID=3345674 RepID=UPI0035DC6E83
MFRFQIRAQEVQFVVQHPNRTRDSTLPLFLFHAVHDEIVAIAPVDRTVAQWCASGAPVTYTRDHLSEHASLAISALPAALHRRNVGGIHASHTGLANRAKLPAWTVCLPSNMNGPSSWIAPHITG